MTAVADPAAPTTATEPNAGWRARALALVIDVAPGAGVATVTGFAAMISPEPWWWLWTGVCGLTLLAIAANRVILPAITGWSLGRGIVGLRVVHADGTPAGPGRLLLREAAHLADTVPLLLGWFWPLRDRRRRTFADLLTRTEVRPADPADRDLRRPLVVLLAAATLVCVAATATTFAVVYRQDRAVAQTRSEIARQGPKIVMDMLNYDPASIDEDFTRGLELTTEGYREQLAAGQQEARTKPIRHAYLVPNSAVLDAAADQATLLVYLRGELGVAPEVWNSTATAVVRFAKRDHRWLVDDLTIVPKSQRGEGP